MTTFVVGCTKSTGIISDGKDAYLIMMSGKTGFVSSGSLKIKAYTEANNFCSEKGMVSESLNMDSKRAGILGKFPEATLHFRCVEHN